MRRASLAVLVAVATLATPVVLLATAGPASAATVASAEEADLLRLTNADRAAAGLPALADDAGLQAIAREWAVVLADSANLRHNPDLVRQVDERVTRDWTRIGENVGRGADAHRLQSAFMQSPNHRANILGQYNRVGVGAARDARGQLWVAVVFLQGPPLAPAADPANWAPFTTAERFAEQQYRDLLGRPADAGGVRYWAGQLRTGATTGAGLVTSFVGSPEYAGVLSPVVRLYLGGFARVPDQPGLQSWLDTRRRGASLETIADSFASSAEFRSRYDRYDHRAFVDALYRTVFGRPADQGALDHWAGALAAGRMTRGGVLLGVTSSAEFADGSAPRALVTMAYVGLLRRSPTASEFTSGSSQLANGRPLRDLVGDLLASAEYRNRF